MVTIRRRRTDPPVVLVDMDDTIARLTPRVLDLWLEENPNRKLPRGEQTTYYAQDWVNKRYRGTLGRMFNRPGLFRDLEPVEDAIDALYDMEAAGLRVMLCSTPLVTAPQCTSEKMAWVEEHLDIEFAKRTILCEDKSLIFGDILIDDRPNPVMSIKPSWTHVLFTQSYNAHIDAPRISDWSQWRSVIEPILQRDDRRRLRAPTRLLPTAARPTAAQTLTSVGVPH